MAWVQSHQSLLTHRKTLALSDEWGVDRVRVIGHLHALWWWGLDNADSDGTIGPVSDRGLAIAGLWPSTSAAGARKFVQGLVKSGFLESTEAGYCFHNWLDYSGGHADTLQARRDASRLRKQRQRERERDTSRVTPSVTVTPMSRSVTPLEKRREEKRREEKRREEKKEESATQPLLSGGGGDVTRDIDERADTLAGLLPGQRDVFGEIELRLTARKVWEHPGTVLEIRELVEDYEPAEVREAIARCRERNEMPWPGNLRRDLLANVGGTLRMRQAAAAKAVNGVKAWEPDPVARTCQLCGEVFDFVPQLRAHSKGAHTSEEWLAHAETVLAEVTT